MGIIQLIPQETNPWVCSLENISLDSTYTTTAVLEGQVPSVLVGKMTMVQMSYMELHELIDWQNVSRHILV